MSGRQILDEVLIANELVDEAHKTNKELVLFKVDFEKTYNSVSWEFLDYMMMRMGFHAIWRCWIRECLSMLVNGSPTEELITGRGLRQGDSLSPFLFLIVVEGLSVLFREAQNMGIFA